MGTDNLIRTGNPFHNHDVHYCDSFHNFPKAEFTICLLHATLLSTVLQNYTLHELIACQKSGEP